MSERLDVYVEHQWSQMLMSSAYGIRRPGLRWVARRPKNSETIRLIEVHQSTAVVLLVNVLFLLPITMFCVFSLTTSNGLGLLDRLFLVFMLFSVLVAALHLNARPRFVVCIKDDVKRGFSISYRVPFGLAFRSEVVHDEVAADQVSICIRPPTDDEAQGITCNRGGGRYEARDSEWWGVLNLGEKRLLIAFGERTALEESRVLRELVSFGLAKIEPVVRRPMPEL